MNVEQHDFEKMQTEYQQIRHTWMEQDDATKRRMLGQIREIYRSLLPGERGFMTDIHHLERTIALDVESHEAAR